MRLLAGLSLVAYALAARVNVNKRASPLEVKLTSVGNSAVKATFTNTGSEPLKIFKTGSVLDSTAIEKAEIFSGSEQIAFDGIRLSVARSNLDEESFQTIAAGETVEAEWDPAEVHDLSAGGDFEFLVRGSFLTADQDTTDLTGAVPFDSDALTSHVDGAAAAKVRRDFHANIEQMKRTVVQSDCTGARGTAQRTALSNCVRLANAAATAATSGSAAKLTEYFASSAASTRTTVANVFRAVAGECGSTTGGASDQFCTDVLGACSSNVLAYTSPGQSLMVSCPLYFNALPALTSSCHAQDQATTTLHETTHLRQIRGTSDLGYGYNAATSLSASQSLNNADTYALFSNAIFAGC